MSAPEPRAISERGFAGLRVAATLLHGVPGLTGRLRVGPSTVARIGRGDDPQLSGPARPGLALSWTGDGEDAPVLAPCAFRAAVVDACRRHQEGLRLAVRGGGGDPDIDIGVPPGGAAFTGGIHRVPCAGRWLYAFALCGDAARFAPLVESVVAEMAGPRPAGRLGLRPDEPLGTSLCFVELDGARAVEDRPVVDLLGALLARFTVEELCAVPVSTGS
jgi:hypothetical protein